MPLTPEKAKEIALRGAGRPPGSISRETKIKQRALKQINIRVAKMADKLLNAQAVVALGTHRMVIRTNIGGVPSIETVRDEKRMQDLLDTGVYGTDYLILEGSKPDWKAANALLDRTFGKAKESLTLDGEVVFSLQALAIRRKTLDAEQEAAIEGELASQ